MGIETMFVRSSLAGNQLVKALDKKSAERIRQYRTGMISLEPQKYGEFYIIIPNPDICPLRVKLGYSDSLSNRVNTFKTICPNLILVKSWPANKLHEQTIIAMATTGFKQISQEVFDIPDEQTIKSLCSRLDLIFSFFKQ